MTMKKAQTDLFAPIWGDYFAGGAGASTGIACACGEPAYFAVNHSRAALDMYRQNHPYTRLYCEDVFDIDPVKICEGHKMWLLWASPDCTHHSKARGGKPVSHHIRGLPWAIVRAAMKVKPGCIMFENVEEIQSWGPCITNEHGEEYPDPERAGETFQGFIAIMTTGIAIDHPALLECCEFLKITPDGEDAKRLSRGLGYEFEGRELVAADYGAPTIRKRFYGIFRCDGQPIVWPEPTHSKDGAGEKKKWRSAAEIIDWSLPCPSIFESKTQIKAKYGLAAVRPLADNTQRRIIRGVDKFTIKSGDPFIVKFRGESTGSNISLPLPTVTSGCGSKRPAGNAHALAMAEPRIAPFTATNTSNSVGSTASEPVHTVTSAGNQMLIAPTLIQYHTEQTEKVRGQSLETPLQTVDAANRFGLASANLTEYFGNGNPLDLTEPLHTVTAKDREALTLAHIQKYFGGVVGADADEPLPTVTGVDHNALCLSHVAEFKGTDKGQSPAEPLRTITASAGEFGAVKTTVIKYAPDADLKYWPQIRALLNKYCGYTLADDEVLLIRIGGIWYYIADIGLRMLTPRELYNAQGFLPDYCIEFSVDGKPYSRSEQVARCGNSVCPAMSEALVRANFPDRCRKKIATMSELADAVAV